MISHLLLLSLAVSPSYTNLETYKPKYSYYTQIKKTSGLSDKLVKVTPKNQPETVLVQDKDTVLIDTDQKLSKDEIIQLIRFYSDKYKVDPDRSLRIAKCESGFNGSAKSKSGKYLGVFQQSLPTFVTNAKRLLKIDPTALNGDLDRLNTEQNIIVSVYMFSINQYQQWSCK